MKIGIYKIQSLVNNKVYIGYSNNIERRWYEHIRLLKSNSHYNTYLQKHYNKYLLNKKEIFTLHILEECNDLKLLPEKEQYYINKYKSNNKYKGFNLTPGGEDLLNLSDESKNKRRNTIISKCDSVYVYTVQGKYVGDFKCVPDVANMLKLNKNSVINSLSRGIQLKGYLFYREKRYFTKYLPNFHGTKLIILNSKFELLETMKGMKNAEIKYNIKMNTINSSCNRLQLCNKSYYFIRNKDVKRFEEKYKIALRLLDNELGS